MRKITLLFCLLVFLSACGGSSESAVKSTTTTTTVPATTSTDLGISCEDRDVLLGKFIQARDAVIAGDLFFADCANKKIGEKVFELLERSPTDEELLLLEECL